MPKNRYDGRLEDMERAARRMGHTIGEALEKDFGERIGFYLGLFTFGEGGWSTYISNCQREDMIKALEELLENMKAK